MNVFFRSNCSFIKVSAISCRSAHSCLMLCVWDLWFHESSKVELMPSMLWKRDASTCSCWKTCLLLGVPGVDVLLWFHRNIFAYTNYRRWLFEGRAVFASFCPNFNYREAHNKCVRALQRPIVVYRPLINRSSGQKLRVISTSLLTDPVSFSWRDKLDLREEAPIHAESNCILLVVSVARYRTSGEINEGKSRTVAHANRIPVQKFSGRTGSTRLWSKGS